MCRDHREKAVRRAVLDVSPRMAAHCARSLVEGVEGRGARRNLFEERYLQSSVELMVTALRSAQYADMHDVIFHALCGNGKRGGGRGKGVSLRVFSGAEFITVTNRFIPKGIS